MNNNEQMDYHKWTVSLKELNDVIHQLHAQNAVVQLVFGQKSTCGQ